MGRMASGEGFGVGETAGVCGGREVCELARRGKALILLTVALAGRRRAKWDFARYRAGVNAPSTMIAQHGGMSSYHRMYRPGGTIFFTVTLADRGSRLLVERIGDLRAAYGAVAAERPFYTEAVVVMPDHIHAVWRLPEGDTDYSVRWGAIKAGFTRRVRDACAAGFDPTAAKAAGLPVGWNPTLRRSASKARKGDAGIWQRRFWEHTIRDEADFAVHVSYCHFNPVKHGFVERAEDWPYSSVHREIRAGRWVA